MPKEAVTITDQRTDKTYELPIEHETIRAMDLRKIKVQPDDFGLMTYDPAFMNTACCKSNITFIDGDKGILRYRGYDIDDLAENCTFLQVAYLLLNGELPNPERETRNGCTTLPITPCCTRPPSTSSMVSATTPIPWECS